PSASASPSPSASSSPNASAAAAYQNFLSHLAQRLNISTSQADSALKGAEGDSVADAVKAGTITQQQANNITQRIQNGTGPFGFAFGGRPGGQGRPGPAGRGVGITPNTVLNAAATALGMQTSDLQTQLRGGKSLQDIATSKNIPFTTVQNAIKAAVQPQL